MEEMRKRKVSAAGLCTKASPIDFHGVSLDDDALTQILVRLPAKSVIKFKLVCKSWLSLISSQHFRRLHALCKRPISLIVTTLTRERKSSKHIVKLNELIYSNQTIKRGTEKQSRMPFDICFDDMNISVYVLSCCWNGLLLLRNSIGRIHVYNPTTNQLQTIFLPEDNNPRAGSLHLVFDPSKSLHYKIVSIRKDRQLIRAFDSESRTWSVCVEGITRGKSLFYLIHRGHLYCFNIVKNVSQFTVCSLPKLADQIVIYGNILQESNGCVYYCAFVGEDSLSTSAALWELQVNWDEDDPRPSKWLLKYHHRIPPLPALCVSMLAFVTETSTVLYVPGNGRIMAYSFLDKSSKELLRHSERNSINYNVHVGENLPSF